MRFELRGNPRSAIGKMFTLDDRNPRFEADMIDHTRKANLTFRKAAPEQSNGKSRAGDSRTIRDKDNTAPKPKPPFHLDHPRLAPLGATGIRRAHTELVREPSCKSPGRPIER
ncbi:hypothetical protein [Stakelama tenebrarum]|uniref:Uncharacterized protein n=1 Tax=Stakelama tenebrarum TaxID=2711215 RepID=A0A6G6Y411_9SPHN|nr:hypothetical protein [Sphingosinithalassobacter tenebrarum]QIG79640.1 hypothetical protein G5C33_07440 [Sphingosinithalassobacter tenebrarum]